VQAPGDDRAQPGRRSGRERAAAPGVAQLLAIELPLRLLDSAAKLSAVHGLRTMDAVQLASGCAAREADAGCDSFACFDQVLRRAAATEGFSLIPHDLGG